MSQSMTRIIRGLAIMIFCPLWFYLYGMMSMKYIPYLAVFFGAGFFYGIWLFVSGLIHHVRSFRK
jgi:hypothetical protein